MLFVLTGYNRNSKFDLVANGPRVAQNLRIAPLLGVDAVQFWLGRSAGKEGYIQSIVVLGRLRSRGSFVPSNFVFGKP
jgi:hypothetical protein